MITTRVFIGGPADGKENLTDASQMPTFYTIPQCVPSDGTIRYRINSYKIDRDASTGNPAIDNRGRVIYRYFGAK